MDVEPLIEPPDPRNLAAAFLRRGRLLDKDEKKSLGIHPLTIVGDVIMEHFTNDGLCDCLNHTLDLAYALAFKAFPAKKTGKPYSIPDNIPMPGGERSGSV